MALTVDKDTTALAQNAVNTTVPMSESIEHGHAKPAMHKKARRKLMHRQWD